MAGKWICFILGHQWNIAMGVVCKVWENYCTHYICGRCGKKKITRKGWNAKEK